MPDSVHCPAFKWQGAGVSAQIQPGSWSTKTRGPELPSYFLVISRLASQSRDRVLPFRSDSILPLMVSSETLPL